MHEEKDKTKVPEDKEIAGKLGEKSGDEILDAMLKAPPKTHGEMIQKKK